MKDKAFLLIMVVFILLACGGDGDNSDEPSSKTHPTVAPNYRLEEAPPTSKAHKTQGDQK